jgi:hypothetical protein
MLASYGEALLIRVCGELIREGIQCVASNVHTRLVQLSEQANAKAQSKWVEWDELSPDLQEKFGNDPKKYAITPYAREA